MKKTQRTVKREDALKFTTALLEFRMQFQALKREAEKTKVVLEGGDTAAGAEVNGYRVFLLDVLYLCLNYFENLEPLIQGVSRYERDKMLKAMSKSNDALSTMSVEGIDKTVASFDRVRKNLESVVIEEGEDAE